MENIQTIKKIKTVVLVKARWDHRKTANFQRMIPEKQANLRDRLIGHL
jgi:hypothetical protein